MENKKINLKVKLSAYTKGIIPDVSKFIEDAPNDGHIYARVDGKWICVLDVQPDEIVLYNNAGLDLRKIDKHTSAISVRQWVGKESELPEIEDNKTYYVIEKNRPNTIIVGGTAYTATEDEPEYVQTIYGGNCRSSHTIECKPMNSKGEY